jgi:hypothetical protein
MTMHRRPALLALTGLGALAALTGCISSTNTTYTDIERVKVDFASDKAGFVFHEALSRTSDSRRRTEKRTEVDLILIDVEHRVVSGPNRLFIEAVNFADSNRDGVITETEAEIFAKAWNYHRS